MKGGPEDVEGGAQAARTRPLQHRRLRRRAVPAADGVDVGAGPQRGAVAAARGVGAGRRHGAGRAGTGVALAVPGHARRLRLRPGRRSGRRGAPGARRRRRHRPPVERRRR